MRARLLCRLTTNLAVLLVTFAMLFAVLVVPGEPDRPEDAPVSVASDSGTGGGYGSGNLGRWQQQGNAISSVEQIRQVRRDDGIFMFGDSISVQDGKSLAQLLAGTTGDTLATHNWSGQPTAPAVDALEKWARYFATASGSISSWQRPSGGTRTCASSPGPSSWLRDRNGSGLTFGTVSTPRSRSVSRPATRSSSTPSGPVSRQRWRGTSARGTRRCRPCRPRGRGRTA